MKIEAGAAYYPEDFDLDRVRYDAKLIREAGLSYVRMGEFAWSHLEPEEGKYQFQWLKDAVRILGEQGIRSFLCTPSSAAPAWMCRKYPEVLRMKRNGERAWFGVRDHTCYTSGKYREFVMKMAHEMAVCFQDDPYVAGWQIDNEAGCSRFPECFCPDCQAAFRRYLKGKYHTLENLNNAWHTQFWSGEFSCWEELELEANWENMGSCRVVESKRFRSREQADFVLLQVAEIRKVMPNTKIGTNNYCLADRYQVFRHLDYAGNDYYPNYMGKDFMNICRHKMWLGLYTGLGAEPWILETAPGAGWPMKNLTEFFYWLYAGFGYNKIFYFPWIDQVSGNEKIHLAVLNAANKPGPQYEHVRNMLAKADRVLASYPDLPQPQSECAIINDYENEWIYCGSQQNRREAYTQAFYDNFRSLCKAGNFAETISPNADWSRFRLVLMPSQAHISKALAAKMKKYVSEGGTLLLNGCTGCFDGNGNNLEEDGPQHIQDLAGFVIGENWPIQFGEFPVYQDDSKFAVENPVVCGTLNGKNTVGTLGMWTGYLRLTTAKSVMTFSNSLLKDLPFCTVNRYGKGKLIYYAADRIDETLCDRIVQFAAETAGVVKPDHPEKVNVMRRGPLMFLHNFDDKEVEFPVKWQGKNLIGNAYRNGTVTLGAQNFAVIEAF